MSYYPTPGTPYVPQQPVNPYGGMGTVGLAAPLPSTQMQQAQPQRPQPMNGQQPAQQSAQDGGWLLGRPVSSREEFLAIPSDLYGRPTYCPDLRSGVIYCKRLNPDTCESYVRNFTARKHGGKCKHNRHSRPLHRHSSMCLLSSTTPLYIGWMNWKSGKRAFLSPLPQRRKENKRCHLRLI